MAGYSVVEELFDKHYRVLRVDYGRSRVYIIDYYARLPKPVDCSEELDLGGVTLCYTKLGLCEAVVSQVGGVVELISLRLYADQDADPAGGSLGRARELCTSEASKLLEALGA